MARSIAEDVLHRLIDVLHNLDGQRQVEKLLAEILFARRLRSRGQLAGLLAPTHFDFRRHKLFYERPKPGPSNPLMNQERFHGVTRRGTLDFGVETDPFGYDRIGITIHIGVAYTGLVLDDGDRRMLHDKAHQGFAASRNNQIDMAILLQEDRNEISIRPFNKGDCTSRNASLLSGFRQ